MACSTFWRLLTTSSSSKVTKRCAPVLAPEEQQKKEKSTQVKQHVKIQDDNRQGKTEEVRHYNESMDDFTQWTLLNTTHHLVELVRRRVCLHRDDGQQEDNIFQLGNSPKSKGQHLLVLVW
jgi:hypothetical protein